MNALKSLRASTARMPAVLTAGLIALLMSTPPAAFSQVRRWLPDSTVPPLKRMYNVPETEFTIAACAPPPVSGSTSNYWPLLDSLGMNLFFWSPIGEPTFWDDLATSRYNANQRYVPSIEYNGHRIDGQQAVFYPFDSLQTSAWLCRFTGIDKGDSVYNSDMHGSERVYDNTNTTAGDSVAWGIVYDWTIAGLLGASNGYHQSRDYLIATQVDRGLPMPDTQYVVVTGHLFSGGLADPNTSLLQIKVWYTIPKDSLYVDGSGGPHKAMNDTSYLFTTIDVPKSSLSPSGGQSFNQYQTVSFPLCLNTLSGVPGPLTSGNHAHSFDLTVVWTGAEKVAVRSVAIRDSIGELILGDGPRSVTYRTTTLVDDARRLLYGPSLTDTARRHSVYAIQVGSESPRSFAACYAVVDSILRSSFNTSYDTVYADVIENADIAYNELTDAPQRHRASIPWLTPNP